MPGLGQVYVGYYNLAFRNILVDLRPDRDPVERRPRTSSSRSSGCSWRSSGSTTSWTPGGAPASTTRPSPASGRWTCRRTCKAPQPVFGSLAGGVLLIAVGPDALCEHDVPRSRSTGSPSGGRWPWSAPAPGSSTPTGVRRPRRPEPSPSRASNCRRGAPAARRRYNPHPEAPYGSPDGDSRLDARRSRSLSAAPASGQAKPAKPAARAAAALHHAADARADDRQAGGHRDDGRPHRHRPAAGEGAEPRRLLHQAGPGRRLQRHDVPPADQARHHPGRRPALEGPGEGGAVRHRRPQDARVRARAPAATCAAPCRRCWCRATATAPARSSSSA